MNTGFGPYGVITAPEIFGTLAVLCGVAFAMLWMAYRTRRHV